MGARDLSIEHRLTRLEIMMSLLLAVTVAVDFGRPAFALVGIVVP